MTFKKAFEYLVLMVLSTLFTLGILFWLFMAVLIGMAKSLNEAVADKQSNELAMHSFVELRLDYPVHEKEGSPFSQFNPRTFKFEPSLTFGQLLDLIRYAQNDRHVDGIVIHSNAPQLGWAQTEELRRALEEFKTSTKPVWAYLDVLEPKNYYLASVGDRVYFNPVGMPDWKGLAMQLMFFKDLLDKLHINVQVIRHGKFKSAVEPFIQRRMSPENREQNRLLLTRIWNEVTDKVSRWRHIPVDSLNAYAARLSLRDAEDLVQKNLINDLMYLSAVKKHLLDEDKAHQSDVTTLDDIHIIDEKTYFKRVRAKQLLPKIKTGKRILAVLTAEGDIVPGEGKEDQMSEVEMVRQIRKLKSNKKVKGVVLRIDSPGGSAMASESIWNELKQLAEVKPLVVSMGNVAASGGYYIATAGEHIFADRTTITGSIGVFGLIPDLHQLTNEMGVTVDTVKTHPHADMGIFRPLDTVEKAYYQEMVENTYRVFLQRVADSRHMTLQEVDSIAQGRVWSGEDAVRIGLADEIGGLDDAVTYMKHLLGDEENLEIKYYPANENPLLSLLSMQSDVHIWQRSPVAFKDIQAQMAEWYRRYRQLLTNEKVWMRMEAVPVIE